MTTVTRPLSAGKMTMSWSLCSSFNAFACRGERLLCVRMGLFNTPTCLYLMLLAVTMSIFSLFRVLSTSAIIIGVFDFFGAGPKFMPFASKDFCGVLNFFEDWLITLLLKSGCLLSSCFFTSLSNFFFCFSLHLFAVLFLDVSQYSWNEVRWEGLRIQVVGIRQNNVFLVQPAN